MQYRREIDGLRAVAVLPVILFHAGFEVFSGGYIGVDVFFVISGYLITSIIIGELARDDFSIARFYERRARRILPALFVVMLACVPFGYLWMAPSQFKDFAESLVAVVFFASNILFWRESGYFGADAELKPLLHTWSLAVEEQYYLLFPIFLLGVWRFGRQRVFWSIIAIAVLSLVVAEWGWRNKPVANFYLSPTRAWELLSGSICGFLVSGSQQRSSNILSLLGLVLLVFGIVAFDANTPFPSIYALVPVIGTALIILFAAEGTWVANLLSLRVFVGVGLISYSAYLWHQPLFAFARLRSLTEPSHSTMALLAVAAMLLAWGTWQFIEQPFRRSLNPVFQSSRLVFIASGCVGAFFVAIGLAGRVDNGLYFRFDDQALRFVEANSDTPTRSCLFDASQQVSHHPQQQCLSSKSDAVDVLLIGDSHMWALTQVLDQELTSAGVGTYMVSRNGCLPLRGFRLFGVERTRNCEGFLARAFDWAERNNISTVVLAARFPLYLHGTRYDNREGGVEAGPHAWVDLAGRNSSEWDDEARLERVLEGYEREIRKLAQHFKVVLVYPIPEAGWNVPNYGMKKALFEAQTSVITTSYDGYLERAGEINSLFDGLVLELPSVFGAPVHKTICNDETMRCVNSDSDGVYYSDDDHLSNTGARLVTPMIIQEIKSALQDGPT